LIQALLAARKKPGRPDGFLRRIEIQETLGVPKQQIYDMLHSLNNQGRLECRRITLTNDMTGERMTIPAYRLKQEEEGK